MYHCEVPTWTHLIFLLIKLKEGGHNFKLQSILENCWRQKDSPNQLLSRLAHRTGWAQRAGPPAEPSILGAYSPPNAVKSRSSSIAAAGILVAPTPEHRGGAVCSEAMSVPGASLQARLWSQDRPSCVHSGHCAPCPCWSPSQTPSPGHSAHRTGTRISSICDQRMKTGGANLPSEDASCQHFSVWRQKTKLGELRIQLKKIEIE